MIFNRIGQLNFKYNDGIFIPSVLIQLFIGFKNPFPVARNDSGYQDEAYEKAEKLLHDFGLNFRRRLLLPRFLLLAFWGSSNRVITSWSEPASNPIFSTIGFVSNS